MDKVERLGKEFFSGLRDTIEVTVTISLPVQDKWQFAAGDALREVAKTIYMFPDASQGWCDDVENRYKANFQLKGN
jgi:hypothetical protein